GGRLAAEDLFEIELAGGVRNRPQRHQPVQRLALAGRDVGAPMDKTADMRRAGRRRGRADIIFRELGIGIHPAIVAGGSCVIISSPRGCSSMVERRLPKPQAWVRFPSPAPSSFQPLENIENLTNIGVGGCRNGYTNGYSINLLG